MYTKVAYSRYYKYEIYNTRKINPGLMSKTKMSLNAKKTVTIMNKIGNSNIEYFSKI